jgi:hypothetical protein
MQTGDGTMWHCVALRQPQRSISGFMSETFSLRIASQYLTPLAFASFLLAGEITRGRMRRHRRLL